VPAAVADGVVQCGHQIRVPVDELAQRGQVATTDRGDHGGRDGGRLVRSGHDVSPSDLRIANDASVILRSGSTRVRPAGGRGALVTESGGSSALGPLEAEVMAVLWQAEAPVSVRAVADRLNADRTPPLAYTTVMTVLSRLAGKGILVREQQGRGFVYTPVVADTADIAVREVLAEFGDAALARFVERVELDPGLRARLRKLMGATS